MTIRIVLADDHEIVRDGLRGLLEREDDMQVVGEAADGLAAVEMTKELTPDVVVMDISMAGMNGVEATRRITTATPGAKVLCLSMHAEERFVWAVLEAGASGYLLKENSSQELTAGVRAVAKGETYLGPSIAGTVTKGYTATVPPGLSTARVDLTTREREVLQLLAEGHPTKRIAARLGLSPKTVATHREHLMKKLDLDSVAGLTKYAIRHGLTTSDRAPRG